MKTVRFLFAQLVCFVLPLQGLPVEAAAPSHALSGVWENSGRFVEIQEPDKLRIVLKPYYGFVYEDFGWIPCGIEPYYPPDPGETQDSGDNSDSPAAASARIFRLSLQRKGRGGDSIPVAVLGNGLYLDFSARCRLKLSPLWKPRKPGQPVRRPRGLLDTVGERFRDTASSGGAERRFFLLSFSFRPLLAHPVLENRRPLPRPPGRISGALRLYRPRPEVPEGRRDSLYLRHRHRNGSQKLRDRPHPARFRRRRVRGERCNGRPRRRRRCRSIRRPFHSRRGSLRRGGGLRREAGENRSVSG